ncbi:chromosome partitioning protein, ParB family [Ruminococcaceae bacterium YRB3002]|nr:chromosome partitioning protein, ParB family [Ruminococcaceae bacterium YRB3002]
MGDLNIREKLQQKAELSSLFMTSEDMERAINGHDVVMLKLDLLHEFPKHPYKVEKNDDMLHLISSIEENGVMMPIVVRKSEDEEGYEIISGHRRVFACKEIGKTDIPALIIECDDDDAIKLMVDSNIHRTSLLPSERAYSIRMRYDAMKRQGKRTDLDKSTSAQVEPKLRTDHELAVEFGISRAQVQRYLRLSNLIPDLMELVDEGKIKLTAGIEIAYLSAREQRSLCNLITDKGIYPSKIQAKLLRDNSKNKVLSETVMESLLATKGVRKGKVIKIPRESLAKYFGENMSDEEIQSTIVKAMEFYLYK